MTRTKRLSPPFLEVGFYFADLTETEAFARLVTALLDRGATFTGAASVHRGSVSRRRFAAITDSPLPEPITLTVPELVQSFTDPETRVMEVRLDGAIGISHDASEVVTYVSVSDEASRTDHHPLAICTEGELFCGTGELRPKVARKARAAGMQVYERFRVLVDALRPAYGAITVEIPLCCPTDLRRDPRSLAFRDFFVARTFFGGSIMTKLEALFTGAFVEPVGDGVYVSCSKEFNPEARNVDGDIVQWRSVEMGKLVAAAAEGARARREPQ